MANGPKITPKTLNATGQGGQNAPPYLQTRTPATPGAPPTPVITPAPSVMGDTVAPRPITPPPQTSGPQGFTGPAISAPGAKPPQAGGSKLGDVYNYFKSDLDNQTRQAKSNAVADASKRGVFYGTPLTGSEADIDTQYLRGVGQLQAGMFGNAQDDMLKRLGLAIQLSGQQGQNAPGMPEGLDLSALGALFAQPRNGPATPVITPKGKPAPDDNKGNPNA